jgi:hypothetical protein
MTVQGYGSYQLDGTNPNMLPDGAGDLKYEQDYIRDKAWLWDRIGALLMDLGALSSPAGTLLSGGAVTDDGTHTHVNVAAGVGYAPFTINLGQSGSVPPTTGAEDLSGVRISWPSQASLGTISATGTWYVVVQYAEATWLSRNKAKGSGSWFFAKKPSVTVSLTQTAPTAYQILLATIVVATVGVAWTSNAPTQSYSLPGSGQIPGNDMNKALVGGKYESFGASIANYPTAGSCAATDSFLLEVVETPANGQLIVQLLYDLTQGISSVSGAWMRQSTNGGGTWSGWVVQGAPAVGTVYIQGPNDTVPGTLYLGTTWSDVSSEEAGAFRRMKGGTSPNVGPAQGVSQSDSFEYHYHNTYAFSGGTTASSFVTNAFSSSLVGVGTFAHEAAGDGTHPLRADIETRGYNFGVTKWRRTA